MGFLERGSLFLILADWEVYLNWKAPKDDYTGRFMTNKFLHDYSYIFTPENRENGGIHFKNIVMKIATEDVTPLVQQIELNATITGTDGNIYIVHATHEVLNAKDEIKIDDLTLSEGLIVMQATAQDQSDMMVLYFFANEADKEVIIPAGVYPINRSLMADSVLASTGANEDNTVSPYPISDTRKILRNGQLLLIRNGEAYNVLGTIVQ